MEKWEDYLQILHKYFHDHHHGRCITWINPAQMDPFAEHQLIAKQKTIVTINHPRFDQKFSPYLIELNLQKFHDSEILKLSVEMAWEAWSWTELEARKGQAICGWIGTEHSPSELAYHWGTQCHVHFVANRHKLLRFHDPGVREWLWTFLTPDQKLALVGKKTSIFSIGRQRQLINHTAPDDLSNPVSSTTPLHLQPMQWNYVNDLANIHTAWLTLGAANRRPIKNMPEELSILKALEHATAYAILDDSNRQLFIRHAIEAGCDFHRKARLKAIWDLTQSGEFYGVALHEVLDCEPEQFKDFLLQHLI
jgi:hypothetical protein